jgi:hypothetical protein
MIIFLFWGRIGKSREGFRKKFVVSFFSVVEQKLEMVQKRGLFWFAFLIWGLLRL